MRNTIFKNGLALGHVIECFDNTLYGFFAVLLAPIFFPAENSFMQLIGTFGAFAAGYVTKPIGALVFGMMGDRSSPALPLTLTIGLAGIPTLIIGCLPSAEQIGYWAPIVLVACRMLQGFLYGGEFSGVNVYVYETVSGKDLGKATGFLIASGVVGAILATLVGVIVLTKIFGAWGWRVPFIVGGFLAFFCLALRRSLEHLPRPKTTLSYGGTLNVLYATYKKEMFFCFVLAGLTTIPLYLSTVYSNKIYQDLGFSTLLSMGLNLATMIMNAICLIGAGYFADRFGFNNTIKLGCGITFCLAAPAFWLVSGGGTIFHALGFTGLMMLTGTMINGCAFPFMAGLFPLSIRYSGLAISYTLGNGILSGLAPLIATLLDEYFHTKTAVSLYVMGMCVVTYILHHKWFAHVGVSETPLLKKAA